MFFLGHRVPHGIKLDNTVSDTEVAVLSSELELYRCGFTMSPAVTVDIIIPQGLPALPVAIASRASRLAPFTSGSLKTTPVPPPLWSGPGHFATNAHLSPLREISPYFPSVILFASAASQVPCVGGASNEQGHPQAQLQAMRCSTLAFHLTWVKVYASLLCEDAIRHRPKTDPCKRHFPFRTNPPYNQLHCFSYTVSFIFYSIVIPNSKDAQFCIMTGISQASSIYQIITCPGKH